MTGDPISYLDMGDALLKGQWASALNGYWSPLFPLIEGLALRFLPASILSEPTVVALTQFFIFILSLCCFLFLWSRVLRLYRKQSGVFSSEKYAELSEEALWALGYAVFLCAHLPLLLYPNPDLLLAAMTSLSGGIVLQIYLGQRHWTTFVALGAVLALGFLTKAILLPLSLAFWLPATLAPPIDRRAFSRGTLIAAAFLVVAGPYVAALSAVQGHWTYGSAGWLNVAFHGNNVPYANWQGPPVGYGVPAHPTRQLVANPAVYEFAYPIAGTYPPWDNPTYWNQGIEPRLLVRDEAVNLGRNLVRLLTVFWPQSALLVGVAILLLAQGRFRETARAFLRMWYLWFPAAAAISLYVALFVEFRYLAPFWALAWAPLFCLVRLPNHEKFRRLLKAVCLVCVTMMLFQTGRSIIPDVRVAQRDAEQQVAIARGLAAFGVQPSERVAVLSGFLGDEWERLAHVSVVAEIPDADSFWAGDAARQSQICDLLAAHGVTTLVAKRVPDGTSPLGWRQLDGTPVYARSLRK